MITARTKRFVLMASILGSGIVLIDSTAVNIALPAIRSSLHGGLAAQQWVVESYLLTLASLLLVGGSLGDVLRRTRAAAARAHRRARRLRDGGPARRDRLRSRPGGDCRAL